MKRTLYLTKGVIFGKCSNTEPLTNNIKPFTSTAKNLTNEKEESGSMVLNWCLEDLEAEIFSNR